MVSNNTNIKAASDQPQIYKIRVKGHLDSKWSDWFEGLVIHLEKDGNSLFTGPVADQAALHSVLKKIRDLGIQLVSVTLTNPC